MRVHVHRGHVPRVGEAPVFDAGEDGLHRFDGPLDATALPADDADGSICVLIVGPVVDLGLPEPRLPLRWMRLVADDPAVLVDLLCRIVSKSSMNCWLLGWFLSMPSFLIKYSATLKISS